MCPADDVDIDVEVFAIALFLMLSLEVLCWLVWLVVGQAMN